MTNQETLRSASCLVTGGAGFIGSHLVHALLSFHAKVRVLDDFSSGSRRNLSPFGSSIELVEGDIRDFDCVRRAMQDIGVVFHLAAMSAVPASVSDPLTCHAVNATGTLHILKAACDAGVRRVVLASSAAVYGSHPTLPKTEDMAVSPVSPYAASKAAGEVYAGLFWRTYGLQTVCLRPFNVYGPRQDPESPYSGVVSQFLARLLAGKSPIITGDGQQSRDFVFVSDVARAFILAAGDGAPPSETFNVGSGSSTTIEELAFTLARIVQPGRQFAPVYEPERTGDIRHSRSSIHKAEERLGYKPQVSPIEGLMETVGWYRREIADGQRRNPWPPYG